MATPLNMPQMGYDMHEGTLVRWLKSEDSEVSLGEPIAEIETDKAVVEVEATAAGLLRKILAAEGATVPVGEPIAIIGEAGEDIAGLLGAEPAAEVAGAEEPAAEPTPEVAEEPTGIPLPPPAGEPGQPTVEAPEEDHDLRASPVARRLAAERGINLSLITGTGPGNRITRDDVLWYKPPEEAYDEPEAADEEPAEPAMEDEAADEEPAEPATEAADVQPAEPTMEDEAADVQPAEPTMEDEAADEQPEEPAMEDEAADEQPEEPVMEAEAADEQPEEPAMEAEAADEQPEEPAMEDEAADEQPEEPAMEDEAADEEPAEPAMEDEAADEQPAEPAMEDEAADEVPAEPVIEAEAEEPAEPAIEAEVEEPAEPEMEAADEEPAEPEAAPEDEAPSNVVPLSRTRRQIARVTSRSKQEIPHFYVSAEIDMTQAMEMRRQLNGRLDDDSRVSVNDLVVKASVDALVEFPNFNASYSDDGIVLHDSVNVGLAIAQDDGLIVPALLDCAGKSLVELAAASKDLARRAGSGALQAEEYAGATFAISNMGMFGVSSFVAIIQPPQSAILAVGAVATQAVIRDDDIVAADMMTATLSADHRVVDGADGARFIGEIKRILENPFTLLL